TAFAQRRQGSKNGKGHRHHRHNGEQSGIGQGGSALLAATVAKLAREQGHKIPEQAWLLPESVQLPCFHSLSSPMATIVPQLSALLHAAVMHANVAAHSHLFRGSLE